MTIEDHDKNKENMKKLIDHHNDPVFNDIEKAFIRELIGYNYRQLTKHQKIAINRLIGWLDSN